MKNTDFTVFRNDKLFIPVMVGILYIIIIVEHFQKLIHLLDIQKTLINQGLTVVRNYKSCGWAENGVTVKVTPFFCVQG